MLRKRLMIDLKGCARKREGKCTSFFLAFCQKTLQGYGALLWVHHRGNHFPWEGCLDLSRTLMGNGLARSIPVPEILKNRFCPGD